MGLFVKVIELIINGKVPIMTIFRREFVNIRIWFLNYTSKAISLKRHAEFEEFHTRAAATDKRC